MFWPLAAICLTLVACWTLTLRMERIEAQIRDMRCAKTSVDIKGALLGKRLSKDEFLLLVRESVYRLRAEDSRGDWVREVMAAVNRSDGDIVQEPVLTPYSINAGPGREHA